MKDSEFKKLPHVVGQGQIDTRGSAVHKGYKPDVTVVDGNNNLTFILESERKTDRKAFLGDVVKAQKYAEECNASPALIIVMHPQPNTTARQIAEHLHPYVTWLKSHLEGGLRLSGILVISDAEYQASIEANELLGSETLIRRGVSIQI
jgi:hypothetical protein